MAAEQAVTEAVVEAVPQDRPEKDLPGGLPEVEENLGLVPPCYRPSCSHGTHRDIPSDASLTPRRRPWAHG